MCASKVFQILTAIVLLLKAKLKLDMNLYVNTKNNLRCTHISKNVCLNGIWQRDLRLETKASSSLSRISSGLNNRGHSNNT